MLVNLENYGLLKISGPDAKRFLQGQLTCNVEEATNSHCMLGAHCNPQGRIIFLFQLFLFSDAYYFLLPKTQVENAKLALQKYAVFYKTLLEESEWVCIGINSNKHYPGQITLSKNRKIVCGDKKSVENCWEIIAQQESVSPFEEWKKFDLIEKIPTIYPETSARFLPHDLGLHHLNAIHFSKGCYTGQEIIARMHYKGKIKKHLYTTKIQTSSPILPGTEIHTHTPSAASQIIGNVVDSCLYEDNNCIALIMVDEMHAKNNHLFLPSENQFFEMLD